MYRQYTLLLVFPLLVTFGFLYLQLDDDTSQTGIPVQDHSNAINRVIGDESFIETYGVEPDQGIPERLRIKTHLQYVEKLLRSRSTDHLTDELKRARFQHLDHLREYILAGNFPMNDNYPDKRRPTFISQNGHICAVGYLVEQDLGKPAAEVINNKYKYAHITEIDDPIFLRWIESSGFTIRELALIQPAYQPTIIEEVKRNENQVSLSYGIGSSLLTGANVLYHTNNSKKPWLFDDASSSHWFGLAAGSGSVILGALNLDNKRIYTEPIAYYEGDCWGYNCPPLREVTATNDARKALSIANMGVGAFTFVRAGYHLIKKTGENRESKKPSFGVTQLEPDPLKPGMLIPAIEMHVRF